MTQGLNGKQVGRMGLMGPKGRMLSVVIISWLFAGMYCAPAARADQKSDEKTVRAVHAKLVSAFKKKDLDGIMALSTKDFTEEDSQGKKYTAQQSANEMKQHFAMMKGPMNVEMAMSKLAVKGDTASYTSTFKMSGSMLDKDGIMGPKGKTHTMAGSGVETIELAKQQGAWKYKHVKGISQKMLLDGKPYNPGAQPPPHSGRPQNPHKAKP